MNETSTEENKKVNEKKEEVIDSYYDGKETYRVGDTVYIESQRSDMPYFICSIRDFKKSKKDNITIDVVWYYRPCEIPTSVYQLLLQDRNAENGSSSVLDNPIVKERELFISDAIDMYPASALRGRANCLPFSEVKENIAEYIAVDNNWYYILRYNPESRRMANAKGEIRIGASHQAILPPCIPVSERSHCKGLKQTCFEELLWEPSIPNSKLLVYLRAARSITSYNGYRDKDDGGPEKAVASFSQDFTTACSYDVLHAHNYNIATALQYLSKNPLPRDPVTPWSDDERKKFMKGLRSYGKTFHKIRKELLPNRDTSELVKYYYLWKKTAPAINSRPHKRGGRRNNLVRKTRTTKPKTAVASEFLDLSSCNESELNICDDSENERDLSLYACRHCFTTKSRNWHHGGKLKLLLCDVCRMHFKWYGRMKSLKEEDKREPPPYIYKSAFANLEDQLQYSGRMRTRRSTTPIFTSGNSVRSRILQEAKLCNRKQLTQVSGMKIEDEDLSSCMKIEEEDELKDASKRRKLRDNSNNEEDSKKARLEADEGEDADDECEGESESEELNNTPPIQSPITTEQGDSNEKPPTPADTTTFIPIKEEVDTIDKEDEDESIPDIPDEKAEKISQRFKHVNTEPSCARCSMVYVFKRAEKSKPTEQEFNARREENKRFRELEEHKRFRESHMELRNGSSPPRHQPAQITSYYDTKMRMFAAQNDPHRPWCNVYPPESHHSPRTVSPRDYLNDPSRKFNHLLKMFDRQVPPDHRPPNGPRPHNPGPFTPRPNECEFRPGSTRSHISSHVPAAIENLSCIPSGLESINRVHGLDRTPTIDPATGLPHIQPHVHSHLHTHTHLHVHPDDLKYRGGRQPIPQENEHDIHEHQPHQPPPHRPRSREYHEHLIKQYPELLAQMHHDEHLRESLTRNIPPSSREAAMMTAGRDGAVSPSIPHEIPPNVHSDPVAYHLWVTQYNRMRWNTHNNGTHGQAPDLSPHGMPQHPHHIRNEHDKILHEKLVHEKLLHAEREKIVRSLEHSKYMHHILQPPPPREHDKYKVEHGLQEKPPSLRAPDMHALHRAPEGHPHRPTELHSSHRPLVDPHVMRSNDIHSSYHGNMFIENMRRAQDLRSSHEARFLRERYAQEHLERERLSQMERLGLNERTMFHDRARHDRPSIFGHYKHGNPETIDLSEE